RNPYFYRAGQHWYLHKNHHESAGVIFLINTGMIFHFLSGTGNAYGVFAIEPLLRCLFLTWPVELNNRAKPFHSNTYWYPVPRQYKPEIAMDTFESDACP